MKNNIEKCLYLALMAILMARAFCLSCPPTCEKESCEEIGKCDYGMGLDICACCPRCLKGPGEPCGGIWNHEGSCGDNLQCDDQELVPGEFSFRNQLPGKCVPGATDKGPERFK